MKRGNLFLVTLVLVCASSLVAAPVERPITAVADISVSQADGEVQVQVVRGKSTVRVVSASTRTLPETPISRMRVGDADRNQWTSSRAIVVDRTTGQRRMPTAAETNDLVETLRRLTAVTVVTGADGRTETNISTDQVVIARPTEDGTMETRCISSFDEAAEFLGLVKQPAAAGGK
jgi:hypothetical protein